LCDPLVAELPLAISAHASDAELGSDLAGIAVLGHPLGVAHASRQANFGETTKVIAHGTWGLAELAGEVADGDRSARCCGAGEDKVGSPPLSAESATVPQVSAGRVGKE
jgi:hypothetical protein